MIILKLAILISIIEAIFAQTSVPSNNTNSQLLVTGLPNITGTTTTKNAITNIQTGSSVITNSRSQTPVQTPPPTPPPFSLGSILSLPPLVSIDTEVQLVFKLLLPNIPLDQIPIINANKSNLFKLFDSIPASEWAMQPQIANAYSKYLERLYLTKLDKEATLTRIQKLFPYRQDCNLAPIVLAANMSGAARDSFISNALMGLPSQVSGQLCGSLVSLSSLYNQPPTVSNLQNTINNGIPLGAFYQQKQLNALTPNDKLNVLNTLSTASNPPKLDRQTAQSLGQNIPKDAIISSVASVLSAAPIEILNSATSSQIAAVFNKMDVENMDESRINFVANKIASGTSANVLSLLNNGNQKLAEAIPYKRIIELNIPTDTIPLTNLPHPLILNDASNLLKIQTIDKITDDRSLIKTSLAMTPSDIKKLPPDTEIKTAAALLSASNSDLSPNTLTKTQRASLLDSILNYLIRISGSTSPSVYLTYLSSAQVSSLAELFVEANDTILAPLSTLNVFSTLISTLSQVPSKRCNSFLKKGAALYTSYAIKYLKGSSKISASNLDSLGVCFANNIPSTDLNDLSADDLVSKISYFSGNNFQPDQQTATIFGTKITAAINAETTQSDKEDLVFNKLQDTAIFATNLEQAVSSATWLSKGKSLLNQASDSKDLKSEAVKLNRLGVSGESYVKTQLNNLKTLYANAYKNSVISGRKKRAITSLTCQNLYDLSGALDTLSSSDLSTLSQIEFSTCLSFFSTYSWSSEQATALASIAKTYYSNNIAAISDTDIGYLSTILPGFSSTDLQSLKISSLNTINELGQVDIWSNDQDCPQIPYMFSRFLSYLGTNTFNITNLVDLGVIGGGFDITSISSISADQLSFIDLSYMPATTLNSIPLAYFKLLTTRQISQLTNSPYYNSFSKDVTSTLTSLASNTPPPTTTSSNSINIKNNFIFLIFACMTTMLFKF